MFNKNSRTSAILGLGLALILISATCITGIWSPGEALAAQPVDSTFTYQGRLYDASSPAEGNYNLRFKIFDAETDPSTEIGSTDVSNVPVSDGYFNAEIDFSSFVGTAFIGEARWLEIHVQKVGDSGYTQLTPRVPLTAAPYAHSLRPGARVNSTDVALILKTTGSAGYALHATASATTGSASAIYAISSSPDGASLSAHNDGGGYGVYASTNATSFARAAVYGTNSSGTGIGVMGQTVNGYGVVGSASGSGTGVYGESAFGPAAQFVNLGSGHPTVYITATNGTDANALYTSGGAHIEGNLTWKPKTSYISVPAAAFRPTIYGDVSPFFGDPHYINNGDAMWIGASTYPVGEYVAPVQLPHGATLYWMTFHYTYNPSSDQDVALVRSDDTTLAYARADYPMGIGSTSTSITNYGPVDNLNYTYYFTATMPHAGNFRHVVIEYLVEEPY